ncbi:phosphoenolpyruvate carboxykinase (GTP) [Compostimonas suwonensis]|uniref:Phosphoenolpyruvate carboxykinase [GTP] n=1 Tax=Compostimonas suwonensis TaxID=1048394 RepID=A0A2M9BBU6_9MICO|nr:phosphoenolpyruvate carboxykinase (GTP) [Compostimonas suwonensis]PJJ55417.1 phosphoenolpyruvate carboxykinase (GTP) [Compostimonas suwonensis]
MTTTERPTVEVAASAPYAGARTTTDPALLAWVDQMQALVQPDAIVWCDGSQREAHLLTMQLVAEGKLIRLNPEWRPNSFLARTDPSDVARVEDRTFICSVDEGDAGPTNNWREPSQMRAELAEVFEGSMRGRTMYVVPFSMGPVGGPISQLGVQLTDSPYVVVSLGVMTRMGSAPLELIEAGERWVPTVHSVGYPLVDAHGERREDVAWPCNPQKYIVHFPESREVWSYGSGYGGNAILPKKSFALRIASVMARDEGWLAEHMLTIKITSPEGRSYHIAAAFPSACGKTNLAMMRPALPGWRVETIGDDIAWLRPGPDGRLWAINPEAGFFGVAPGTGPATNEVAVETLWGNTIFTNVALRHDGDVWWEGLSEVPPAHLVDWRGEDWTPDSGRPAAHPNSRFTVSAAQCPTIADDWEAAAGVPLDAIIFGGRRASNVPLVVEARDWQHGVFIGATLSSEKTAAAEGRVGELRRDPFAMLPFCGYNMADYWAHWLTVGAGLGSKAPAVFQVNWFRQDAQGGYLWPGFGENARVLEWIVRRVERGASGYDTPIGRMPQRSELDLDGLALDEEALDELFAVDPQTWAQECDSIEAYFDTFDGRVPAALRAELDSLRYKLARM